MKIFCVFTISCLIVLTRRGLCLVIIISKIVYFNKVSIPDQAHFSLTKLARTVLALVTNVPSSATTLSKVLQTLSYLKYL